MFRYRHLPALVVSCRLRQKAAAEAVSILPRPFSPLAPRRSEGNAERAKSARAEEKRACVINYLASALAPRKVTPSAQRGCEQWARARADEPPLFLPKNRQKARVRARFAPSFGGFSRGTGEKSLKTRKSEFLTHALKSVSLLRKGQKGIKTAQRAI